MQRTVFCVQQFVRDARGLAPGAYGQFGSAGEAEREADKLKGGSAGVLIYSMSGDPEWDVWSEPEVFARMGSVPI